MTNDEEEKKYRSNDEKLNQIFGIDNISLKKDLPAVIEQKEQLPAVVSHDEKEFDDDFNETRDTLKELEQTGKAVLDHFVQIAKDSESPRAIEVLGNFMEKLSDISLSKLDIHEKKKKHKQKDDSGKQAPAGTMNIENANILVGTTADLLNQTKNNT